MKGFEKRRMVSDGRKDVTHSQFPAEENNNPPAPHLIQKRYDLPYPD